MTVAKSKTEVRRNLIEIYLGLKVEFEILIYLGLVTITSISARVYHLVAMHFSDSVHPLVYTKTGNNTRQVNES